MAGRHRLKRSQHAAASAPRAVIDSASAAAVMPPTGGCAEPAASNGVSLGPMVLVRQLTVKYGSVMALDGVEAEFAAGRLTAVTGASGAGKSSLLWAMAGALASETVTQGSVHIDGDAVRGRGHTLELGVALLPQGNGLASVLTATENCLVPLLELGVPAREATLRVHGALTAVGLEDSGNHLIEELSGGQQQRVAVARALAVRPRLLLADEPTSELDHTNRERVMGLMELLVEQGTTVVLATHDPDAASVATREIRLDEGQIVMRR